MSKPPPKRVARKRNRGVLASQQLSRLVHDGVISAKAPVEDRQYQPASLDLRLGDTGYRMLSSFLPEQGTIASRLTVQDLYQSDLLMYDIDLRQGAVLEKGHVYLIPLMEEVALPRTLAGKTNSKSTTGRLDVFTRTITDFHGRFDEVRPGYRGKLYLEVVPRSFSVRVKAGMCLNQLRLFSGHPTVGDSELRERHRADHLLYRDGNPVPGRDLQLEDGLFLRIELRGENGIVGFRAKKNSQVLDLSCIGHYDPTDFWEPIKRHRNDTLLLEPEDFYILGSKERIRVPPDYAAEMVAYEAAFGELRTHYAGFFDPGFGYGVGDLQGTPIVLEVRPHDVPFLIHDGQTFFKVLFERMHEHPEKVYGVGLGSSYQFQGLTLSKQFKPYLG
jgi:dCTP deaminase